MVRNLLILRHGKCDGSGDPHDFNSPLKERGKRAAQRMGVWLATYGLIPDTIISSPAECAMTTAEKCCKAMGQASFNILPEQKIWLADKDDLFDVLKQIPCSARRVMLVGHNPGLEDLLLGLVNAAVKYEDDEKLLPTATLALLELEASWSDIKWSSARLVKIVRPCTLPKKFPWPLLNAKETRDRPAYYYNQSSVIPYRLRDGLCEVLIVLSSKGKHWVVPKGIHEPGLTAQQSAAKEAVEEGGVEGSVETKALGRYSYQKWGAVCTVKVYAMKVNNVIVESEWEERHRTRQWVSPQQAATLVRQAELGPMILALDKRILSSIS